MSGGPSPKKRNKTKNRTHTRLIHESQNRGRGRTVVESCVRTKMKHEEWNGREIEIRHRLNILDPENKNAAARNKGIHYESEKRTFSRKPLGGEEVCPVSNQSPEVGGKHVKKPFRNLPAPCVSKTRDRVSSKHAEKGSAIHTSAVHKELKDRGQKKKKQTKKDRDGEFKGIYRRTKEKKPQGRSRQMQNSGRRKRVVRGSRSQRVLSAGLQRQRKKGAASTDGWGPKSERI